MGTDRQMAMSLTRHVDLLWVDPPVSPLTPARYAAGARRLPWPELTRAAPGIDRLRPRAMPLHTRRFVRSTTWPLLRTQVHWALRRLGRRPTAAVACSLDDVLGRWGDGVTDIVYGTDDFVAGARLMNLDVTAVEREEARQLARADAAVVVSDPLAERWRSLGFAGHMLTLPNGVDSAAYENLDQVEPASDVRLPPPVAGVVGQLSQRIDISMLEAVVAAGCSLLLVGPKEPSWEPQRFAKLVAHERVRHVGPKRFEELPRYLRLMDVGLTPYEDSAFNRASFPLKTLEYLAAGKPVVSTDLPAVRLLATDLVTVASRSDVGRITYDAATAPPSPELVRRRRELARLHSWDRRADTFAAFVGLPVVPDAR